jgi:hypothetical protein
MMKGSGGLQPIIPNQPANRERIRQEIRSPTMLWPVNHVEPEKKEAGMVAVADGTNWDPDTSGDCKPYFYNGASWVPFF